MGQNVKLIETKLPTILDIIDSNKKKIYKLFMHCYPGIINTNPRYFYKSYSEINFDALITKQFSSYSCN